MKKLNEEYDGFLEDGQEEQQPGWYIREQMQDSDRKADMAIFFSKLSLREKDDFTALFTQQSSRDYAATIGKGQNTAWCRLKSIKAKWESYLAS